MKMCMVYGMQLLLEFQNRKIMNNRKRGIIGFLAAFALVADENIMADENLFKYETYNRSKGEVIRQKTKPTFSNLLACWNSFIRTKIKVVFNMYGKFEAIICFKPSITMCIRVPLPYSWQNLPINQCRKTSRTRSSLNFYFRPSCSSTAQTKDTPTFI